MQSIKKNSILQHTKKLLYVRSHTSGRKTQKLLVGKFIFQVEMLVPDTTVKCK